MKGASRVRSAEAATKELVEVLLPPPVEMTQPLPRAVWEDIKRVAGKQSYGPRNYAEYVAGFVPYPVPKAAHPTVSEDIARVRQLATAKGGIATRP